jgi:sugar-specific transcriptional regulator TrmB
MDRLLEPLGVSGFDETAYRLLLASPGSTVTDLASAAGETPERLTRALHRLEQLGFVSRQNALPPRFVPAEPEVAIEALVHLRQHELLQAVGAAAELTAEYRAGRRDDPGQLVEILTGNVAVSQRFAELQRGCREEVLLCDRPPYVNAPDNPQQESVLARGVRWRTIYAPESMQHEQSYARAMQLRDHGEQARLLPGLPTKLMIVDRRVALMPLLIGSGLQQSAIIHRSTLLDSMITLFEVFWNRALPLDGQPATEPPSELSDSDRKLLGLLVTGAKDEAIARALGVSLRTLHRRMQQLLTLLDADTRFQAGMQAARRGWV